MRTLKRLFTAEDLFCLSATGRRLELVKGKVYEMAPAGGRHGYSAMNIGVLMGGHVRLHRLGRVFAAETGFIIRRDPDTVRAPDAAYISQDRMSADEIPDSYIDLIPDLVAEVVSPNDRRREVQEKVEEWLNIGVRLVWVSYTALYPATRSAIVYRSLSDVSNLTADDCLDGKDVVPGFNCRVGDLFD